MGRICIYCRMPNDEFSETCAHCGKALPKTSSQKAYRPQLENPVKSSRISSIIFVFSGLSFLYGFSLIASSQSAFQENVSVQFLVVGAILLVAGLLCNIGARQKANNINLYILTRMIAEQNSYVEQDTNVRQAAQEAATDEDNSFIQKARN